MKRTSWITGFILGAGVMYLLDPQSGRRRRALGRDKTRHLVKAAGERSGKRGRDLANRARGLAHAVGGVVRRDRVDDAVLHERVRAELGRHVSSPSAIEVACADGACTLRGPVLAAEADALLDAVARVRGVARVVDELERHAEPGGESGLQGSAGAPSAPPGLGPH
jgi:hypothetical protein